MIERAFKTVVVLVLLLITVAILAPTVIGRIDAYQISKAEQQISIVAAEIETFRRRHGSYPSSLAEAVESDNSDSRIVDPWGYAYNYSTETPIATVAEQPYYVWSLGRDNRVGGEGIDQDRGNWK